MTVLLQEFLLPGQWEIVSALADIPGDESPAANAEIVLRHPIAPVQE